LPAFIVNGITDVTLINGTSYHFSMPLTVQYNDSAQETVTLSVSGLPAGFTMDTTWVHRGIPTYNTALSVSDTLLAGYTPGTYPVIITATGSQTGTKTYQFNINVVSPASCASSSNVLGTFTHCYACGGNQYTDNVTADPDITNKIWFANVYGTGVKLFGYYDCNTSILTFPYQTVGSTSYFGSGNSSLSAGLVRANITLYTSAGTNCTINMQ